MSKFYSRPGKTHCTEESVIVDNGGQFWMAKGYLEAESGAFDTWNCNEECYEAYELGDECFEHEYNGRLGDMIVEMVDDPECEYPEGVNGFAWKKIQADAFNPADGWTLLAESK